MDPPALAAARRCLDRVRLFRGLPEELLDSAAAALQELSHPKGSFITVEGRRTEQALYIVRAGRVRVIDGAETGTPRIVTHLGPGDAFGEIELLTGGPALSSTEAALDTVTMALSFRDFYRILDTWPAASLRLSRLLGRRLKAWSSRTGRRRTTVFLGVDGPARGPTRSLAVLALARGLTAETGSPVMLLDFDPEPGTGGRPGVLRSLSEILDPRGSVEPDLLRDRAMHADDALEFLALDLPPSEHATTPPERIPELLGEAKGLASYVLVNLPSTPGALRDKLRDQVERLVVPLPVEALDQASTRAFFEGLGGLKVTAGVVLEAGRAVPTPDEFERRLGRERGFVMPFPPEAVRALARLGPYPREVLDPEAEAMAQARAVVRRVTRRRLGLCLGSGTALGWAHVGVLKVLVREKIPIDRLAGSSMGALVGALFASGRDIAEVEAMALAVTKDQVRGLADYNWPLARDGALRGERVLELLKGWFGELRIEQLDRPLLIQATDVARGEPYLFRQGPLALAVRASISLPGIFRMVEHEGRFLVDAGVHDTLPIQPLRDAGADLVLAVNTTTDPRAAQAQPAEIGSYNVFDIFLRCLEIMQQRRTGFEAGRADLVLQPRIRDVNWKELWRARELIAFGEEAAEAGLDSIRAMLRKPPV